MRTTTKATLPLFDVLDAMQREAHAPRSVTPLPGSQEPSVTPEPTPEERRDQGIKAAVEHADAEQSNPKWSEQAYAYAVMMIVRRGYKPFLIEEIVLAAARDGVPEPPSRKAWGGVARRLAKDGVTRKMGFAAAATSNTSPKVLWSKAVPEREEIHAHD